MKQKKVLQNNFIIGECEHDQDFAEDIEDISLSSVSDKSKGTIVSSFSFTHEPISSEASVVKQTDESHLSKLPAESLEDNRKLKTEANVSTPSVDGEAYTISRFYKLRYSTAKMLNEIKAKHPNVNVYMNTIVDEAIRYYYSYIFKN